MGRDSRVPPAANDGYNKFVTMMMSTYDLST